MTSSLSCDNRSRQSTSLPVESVKLRIPLSTSWSVRAVNQQPSQYVQSRSTAHTTSKNSQCNVLYAHVAFFNVQDQYPIGLTVLSGCFCKRKHPIRLSPASVSTVQAPYKLRWANTGRYIKLALSISKVAISSSANRQRSLVDLRKASYSTARQCKQNLTPIDENCGTDQSIIGVPSL